MARPSKESVLACSSKAALKALFDANDAACVDCNGCKRCKNCLRCENCTDCKDCKDCVSCREITSCERCVDCSRLRRSYDCVDCHGSDENEAVDLYGCSDCGFVERSFYVSGLRGTATNPVKNRFMHLQLTAAEMDLLLALPLV